jgi:hypothetical protein
MSRESDAKLNRNTGLRPVPGWPRCQSRHFWASS